MNLNNIDWDGDVKVSGSDVTALPENLVVGGWLDLRYTNIIQLPAGLKVGGSLYLQHTKITELPEDLKVGGFLDLSSTKITHLPEGLEVGNIYLSSKLAASNQTKIDLINRHKNAIDWFEDISPELKRLHAMKWKI